MVVVTRCNQEPSILGTSLRYTLNTVLNDLVVKDIKVFSWGMYSKKYDVIYDVDYELLIHSCRATEDRIHDLAVNLIMTMLLMIEAQKDDMLYEN